MAEGIEREARAFYAGLAALFRDLPEVARFFEEMMREEEEHAEMLADLRASLSRDDLARPADPAIHNKVRSFLSFVAVEKLGAVETLDDAYTLATNLEFSEMNKLVELLIVANAHGELGIEHARAALVRHAERLRGFPEAFGGQAWRRGIVARRP